MMEDQDRTVYGVLPYQVGCHLQTIKDILINQD